MRSVSSAARSRAASIASEARYESNLSGKQPSQHGKPIKEGSMPISLVEQTIQLHQREQNVLLHLITSQNELIRQISEETGRLREAERIMKAEIDAKHLNEAINMKSPMKDRSIQMSPRSATTLKSARRLSHQEVADKDDSDYPRNNLKVRRQSQCSRTLDEPAKSKVVKLKDIVQSQRMHHSSVKQLPNEPKLKLKKKKSHSKDSNCCLSFFEMRHPSMLRDSSPGFTNPKLRASIKAHKDSTIGKQQTAKTNKQTALPSKKYIRSMIRQRDDRVEDQVIGKLADLVARRLSVCPSNDKLTRLR